MKKITLLFTLFCCSISIAQQFVDVVTTSGSTSGFSRAPQGTQRYIRSAYIISAAEMTSSGFPSATAINALSFKYSTAQDVPTSGTLKIYLENTTDATFAKANGWTDIIGTMTLAHNGISTIPNTIGYWDIPFASGSPFTYTGGGVYVAFEYENAAGTLAAVGNVADCNNSIVGGLRNIFSLTEHGPTLSNTSNFRPGTRFAFTASCASPSAVTASNISITAANISFTAPANVPANGYEYFISTSNVTPSAASMATAAFTGTTFNVSGLLATTTYNVWVRSICSATTKSLWSTPAIFITNTPPPYSHSFEGTVQPGYLLFSGGGNQWGFGSTAGFAATGTGYAVYSFATTAALAWLFSPPIQLGAGTPYTISFKTRANGTTPAEAESLRATIGNARTVAAQTTTIWDSGLNGVNYTTYATQSGTFTPTVTGGYSMGFNCYSAANRLQLFLDDVTINATLSIKANELNENDISIAPVPIVNSFSVNIENNIAVKNVSIIDLNGRTVLVFDKQMESYNVSSLMSGIYVIAINSEKGTVYKKVVKN